MTPYGPHEGVTRHGARRVVPPRVGALDIPWSAPRRAPHSFSPARPGAHGPARCVPPPPSRARSRSRVPPGRGSRLVFRGHSRGARLLVLCRARGLPSVSVAPLFSRSSFLRARSFAPGGRVAGRAPRRVRGERGDAAEQVALLHEPRHARGRHQPRDDRACRRRVARPAKKKVLRAWSGLAPRRSAPCSRVLRRSRRPSPSEWSPPLAPSGHYSRSHCCFVRRPSIHHPVAPLLSCASTRPCSASSPTVRFVLCVCV